MKDYRWIKSRSVLAAAFACTVMVGAGPRASARSVDPGGALETHLRAALSDRAFSGSNLGLVVVDLDSGEQIFAVNPDVQLIPASLTKVVTSAAALWALKPHYRFKTRIYGDGRLVKGVYQGNLYARGYGDPTLVDERIWLIAQELQYKGVRRVAGKLITDASYFDRERFGAGWGPLTRSWYDAPMGALSVNFNTVRTGNTYIAISEGPEEYAGSRILRIFEEGGLRIEGGLATGGLVPPQANLIHESVSRPLSQIVLDMNKLSNNFTAEQILKTMGAEFGGEPGTTAKGLDVVRQFLAQELEFEPGSFRLEDGSGLSTYNRFTPRQMAAILRHMSRRFDVGPEFVASLKVLGAEGLNQEYFADLGLSRKLRVKTGHLGGVTNLAGVGEREEGTRIAFCIMINGYRGGRYAADKAVDRLARALVQ